MRINGRRAAPGRRVEAGDAIELAFEVRLDQPANRALPDADAALAVVYEDAWLVCANKPAGQPSHPLRPGERGTLASALLARYPELAAVGYSPREPGIVHRLDTGTSGLVLAARDTETFAALRGMLERGELDKRYLALCSGAPAAPAVHAAWLSPRGPRVTLRAAPFARAEPVQTELLAARPAGAFSLVTLRVQLARRHQIRAHLAALGHPIAGDVAYGGSAVAGLSHHFLHASELHFTHPRTLARVSLQAELPAQLAAVLDAV